MTTKTRPKETDASAGLVNLEQEAAAAAAEVQRIKARQQATTDQVNALRVQRLALQVEHPEQFNDGGAKPGSDAAKLTTAMQREVQKRANADYPAAIQAAEVRADRAAEAVVRHRGANARELLLDLLAEDEEATRVWREWAAGASEALRRKLDIEGRADAICTTTGAYDPRDHINFDHYSKLVQDVASAADIHNPLPRALLRELREEQADE